MDTLQHIKLFINYDYFELPKNKLLSKLKAFKVGYSANKIETLLPFLFVVNKTSDFDKELVTNTLCTPFVFLKDEVVYKIQNGLLSKTQLNELKAEFAKLKQALISVVIFPEETRSYFGVTQQVSKAVTDFIYELKFNIKFLSLVNSFFVSPVWTKEIRKCSTLFNQQFAIKAQEQQKLDSSEFFVKFNHFMPSSASLLAKRFNPKIRSNHLAESLETMFCVCPNCKNLFTLYSEFNCIKCKECGTALELSRNGTIELSSKISNLDEFELLQKNTLIAQNFGNKSIITHENLDFLVKNHRGKFQSLGKASAEFFENKIHVFENGYDITITFKEIKTLTLLKDNILHIQTKNDELFLRGNNKENFFFFVELYLIATQK